MKISIQEKLKSLANKKQVFNTSVQIKSVDDEAKTIRFIISTDDEDRHGDVIDQKTWDLKNFKKAPRALLQHEHRSFPIGSWKNLEIVATDRGGWQLEGDLHFAYDHDEKDWITEDSKTGYRLAKAGHMNTISAGFIPKKIEYDDVNDVFILSECELLEASLVSIPANPFALAKELGKMDMNENDVALTDEQRKSVQDAFNVLKSLIDIDNEFKATDKTATTTKKSPRSQTKQASVLKRKKGKAKHTINKLMRKLAE